MLTNYVMEKTMNDYDIIRLLDNPEIKEQAAQWFHEKWGIPLEAYAESMEECLAKRKQFLSGMWQWMTGELSAGWGSLRMIFTTEKTLPQMFVLFIQRKISAAAGLPVLC